MDIDPRRFDRLPVRERKRAREALARADAHPDGSPERLALEAEALLAANDFHRAVLRLERAATLAPDQPGLTEALVGAYRRDSRHADAVRLAATVAAPGRALLFEMATSLLALGDCAQALAIFDRILAERPDHAASWLGSHAAALHLEGLAAGLARLDRALTCPGANSRYWVYRYAYHRLLGEGAAAGAVFASRLADDPRRRPPAESVDALMPHLAPDLRLGAVTAEVLRAALAMATGGGMVLEFGVRWGTSVNVLAASAGQEVHGFDSFEGLPEDWGAERAGVLSTGRALPPVAATVTLHPGWFEDTLPPFLAAHPGPVRLVNIDSDVYSSARTVLTALKERIRPGTILVFDEFIGNRTWAEDEYRAFMEFVAETGARFEIAMVSPFTKQVVVRVL
ncbi:MAG: class I SAM-dependent methyltransferase [Solirubrobacterales bacterium]